MQSSNRRTSRSAELLGRTARLAARMGESAVRTTESMRLLARAFREAEAVSQRRAWRARLAGRRAAVRAWQRRQARHRRRLA